MLRLIPHVGLPDSLNHGLRSEDIRFSPSGRTLAVVATHGLIYLFDVDTQTRPIRVRRHVELRSPSLAVPHGIDFLSEDEVVVANRGGWLTFYRLPPRRAWKEGISIAPFHEMGSDWFGPKGATRVVKGRTVRCGPGSVRVSGPHLFVCCNNQSTVTAHPFTLRHGRVETGPGTLFAQAGLDVPDGLSPSRDGRWLAVGDHEYRRLTVYRRAANPVPSCELRDPGLSHPHGLCFDPTGRALYVADAGEAQLHVFVTPDNWATSMDHSTFQVAAVEPEAFHKTKESVEAHYRALEGGIKGVDVDATGRILATTCQNQMLRFFASELAPPGPTGARSWRERIAALWGSP